MHSLLKLIFMTLLLGLIACGKNNESTGNQTFSSDPYKVTTMEALINVQTGNVEVGGQTYSVTQNSFSVMSQAFQQAQLQGIVPLQVNGVYKYRARITGSLASGYSQYGYPQGGTVQGGYVQVQIGNYNQGNMYPQTGLQQLNVSQAIIHR